ARIAVDRILFSSGTATLTPEGQSQVARVIAFLQETPAIQMALTPIVSGQDVTALKQRGLEAELARIAGPRLAPDEAVAQLFKSRFPDRRVPDAPDAMRAALLDSEPIPPTATSELAGHPRETLRALPTHPAIRA